MQLSMGAGIIHRGASSPGLVIAVKKTVCASAPSWSERDFKGDVGSWTCITLMRRVLWRQSDIWRQGWARFQTEWIDRIAKT